MPRVPYSPVPSAQPSTQGTPGVSVNTPGAAFGTTIADAVQGLGKTMEGVGGELFSRAVAMQELRNETEAREADTKYMIEVGKLHAEYSSLEGKAAVDAFPKYAENMETLRKQHRDGLSNDSSRRMFDSNSLSTMGRTIFNGAGHAATQQRHWAIGEGTAQISLDAKTVEDNPRDDVLFQQKLNRVRQNASNLSALKGFEPGGVEDREMQLKASSQMWANRIVGLSREAPFDAARVLDQRKTEMTEQDYLRVDNTVRAQGRAVGSANIAQEVYSAGVGSGASLKDMEEQARARAKQLAPEDPILAQHAVAALQGKFNQDKYATKQEEIENTQVVDGAIMNGVRDLQQLRADPKVAAAIDALPKSKQIGIPGQINRANDSINKVTNQDNYQTIYGRSINDVEAFLNTDLTKEGLSQADIRKFQALQQKLKAQPGADPRVQRALGWLRGSLGSQLEALSIFRRTDANKDDYDHYTGALSSALDIWQETHGKPATSKDVVETIGPQLIQQRAVPGTIFGSFWPNKEPFFRQEVPDKWSADFKTNIVSEGGIEPTDEQVYRAYVRAQLLQLYGGKKGNKL